MTECKHELTRGRAGERGSWCETCGEKALEVDSRECQHCAHYKKVPDGSICRKHLMAVTPTMNVCFKISNGSCWTSPPEANHTEFIKDGVL